jgi:hypothetical protein
VAGCDRPLKPELKLPAFAPLLRVPLTAPCGDIGDVPRDLAEAALAHSLNATEGAHRRITAVERPARCHGKRQPVAYDDGAAQVIAFPTGKTA